MLTAVAAAIVDSRNMYHQAGDAIGRRGCPTVPGVRAALARYGFDVAAVHVGLALARPSDRDELAKDHAKNEAYRQSVVAAGGDVLLGELHRKSAGKVEEKMVDSACCVRIARYVEEIAYRPAHIESIVVLSKDIDLAPAVDYAVEMQVPIVVGALDVVQHRSHPYVLLGPYTYAEMTEAPDMSTGHELRELLVCALHDGGALEWTVGGPSSQPRLTHKCGLQAVPAPGTKLPSRGSKVSLHPVGVMWDDNLHRSFPLLVCADKPQSSVSWRAATVIRRTAPMSILIQFKDDQSFERAQFPLGGVVPGETVLVDAGSGRVLGRLGQCSRKFDPDKPQVVRVVAPLPNGGALAADESGLRGVLTTRQKLASGQRVPTVQIDLRGGRKPVWAAIGTALP